MVGWLVVDFMTCHSLLGYFMPKLWPVIDKLLIIWKSELSDKIKLDFFQSVAVSVLLYGCTKWMLKKYRAKVRWELHKNAPSYFGQILEATCHETTAVWPLIFHLKTNQVRQRRHVSHCWKSKDKLISDIFQWIPTHECASVGWSARTYLHHLCVDTECSLKDLLAVMDNRNR